MIKETLRVWISKIGQIPEEEFSAQFLFHTKIKTNYQNELPTTKILELRSKRGS